MYKFIFLVIFATFCNQLANAAENNNNHLIINDVWSRATPAANGVVYLNIFNQGKKNDRLISVETEIAKRAEFHTHLLKNGIMSMEKIKGIEVNMGEPTVLQPGGSHIMLIGLKKSLREGAIFQITLTFENAGKRLQNVLVQKAGSMERMRKHHKPKSHSHGS